MIGLSATSLIHHTNHTQTIRVCNISSNHAITDLGDGPSSFNNLNPGIYSVTINNDQYYFDLYITVSRFDKLVIKSPYNSYAKVSGKKYRIILYKKESSNSNNELLLRNTVNDYFDLIVVSGHTICKPAEYGDLNDLLAVIPNDKNIDSYLEQLYQDGTLSVLEQYNTILRDIIVSINETTIDSSGIIENDYFDIRSISNLKISTSINENTESASMNIILKNNIKSLPNGTKDLFILNSELQVSHFIYRVGRKILSGGEDWKLIEELSNEFSYLFWFKDDNIKSEDSSNNLNSSRLSCINYSILVDRNYINSGICTGYGEYANGILLRLPKTFITTEPEGAVQFLRDWLFSELRESRPFIVEYPNVTEKYKTVYLEEYHVNTFYPSTYVNLDENYDVSYFYKALHRG